MPHVLVRRNMQKIAGVLTEMPTVLRGLTRGLDLSMLDRGHGEHGGHALSFYPRTQSLGVVLPSNSPGVHSLWVPAIALKTPLVLKPGSAEPWTPFRIAQAFIKAGCPPAAFSYYPADHAGAGEILRRTRAQHVLRRRLGRRRLGRRSARRAARPRLQQGADRRRRDRRRGNATSSDRSVDRRQRRALVRERVGRVGRRRAAERSPRRWPRGWRASSRAPPTTSRRCWRRSPIRRSPSGSRRRSTQGSTLPGARDVTASYRNGLASS